MKITVNSNATETSAVTLAELAAELSLPQAGVAVAVDGAIVSRADWGTFRLRESAVVVIIRAACGG